MFPLPVFTQHSAGNAHNSAEYIMQYMCSPLIRDGYVNWLEAPFLNPSCLPPPVSVCILPHIRMTESFFFLFFSFFFHTDVWLGSLVVYFSIDDRTIPTDPFQCDFFNCDTDPRYGRYMD